MHETRLQPAIAFALHFCSLLLVAEALAAGGMIELRDGTAIVLGGDTVDYGTHLVGQPVLHRIYTLANVGTEPLAVSSVTVTGSRFVVTGLDAFQDPVPPGESRDFNVRFRRDGVGDFTATVTVRSEAPRNPFVFFVLGRVEPSEPEVEVRDGQSVLVGGDSVDYGTHVVGQPVLHRIYTLTNVGSEPLAVSSVAVTGTRFVATGLDALQYPVPPGESRSFNVRFRRDGVGDFTATVTVRSNAPADPFVFFVSGRVIPGEPAIAVRDGNAALLQQETVDYGTHVVGSPTLHRLYTVQNHGAAPLAVDDVTVTGTRFVVTGLDSFQSPVSPGESRSFNVRFRRDAIGEHGATVTIASDDPNDDPFVFFVTGRVVGSGPQLEIRDGSEVLHAGDTVDYGSFAQRHEPPLVQHRLLTVANRGDEPLSVSSVTVTGNRFVVSGLENLAAPIPPQSSSTINVRYRLDGAGDHTAAVTVRSDDPEDDPFVFSVAGRVVASPSLRVRTGGGLTLVNGDTVTYPDTAVGATNSVLFILENANVPDLVIENPDELVQGASYFVNANGIEDPVIASGESEDFRVALLSNLSGFHQATVRIESNDVENDPFLVRLEGYTGEPDFTLSLVPELLVVPAGTARELAITVQPDFGFKEPVSLSLSGLPAGVTGQPDPAIVAPGETALWRVSVGAGVSPGDYPVTVTGNGAGFVREAEALVRVTDQPPPEVEAISPRKIFHGDVVTVTLTGSHLQGATVRVRKPSGSSSTLPLLREVSVAAGGGRIDVLVDAAGTGVDGYYGLEVETASGHAARPFRVVPGDPVIDVYTPSEVSAGNVYALALVGINLEGASVTASHPALRLLEVSSQGDEGLTGLLVVSSPSVPDDLTLTVTGRGGGTMDLPLHGVPHPAEQSTRNVDLTAEGTGTDPGLPSIYLQEFAAPRTDGDQATEGGFEPPGPPPPPPPPGGGCVDHFVIRSEILDYQKLFLLPLDETGAVDTGILAGNPLLLQLGGLHELGSVLVSVFARVAFTFTFDFCGQDFSACMAGQVGADVPGFGGVRGAYSCCSVPRFFCSAAFTASTGELLDFSYSTEGCSSADPPVPVPTIGGDHFTNVRLDHCCSDTVRATLSGVTNQPVVFEDTIDVVDVEPEQCEPVEPPGSIVDYYVVSDLDPGPPSQVVEELSGLQTNLLLQLSLSNPLTCIATLGSWITGHRFHVWTDRDRRYANAFLYAGAGNARPPDSIDAEGLDAFVAAEEYKLFSRLAVRRSLQGPIVVGPPLAAVGSSPDPCGVAPGQPPDVHHDNGVLGTRLSGQVHFLLNEGRRTLAGQIIDTVLNDCPLIVGPICSFYLPWAGQTTPWLWSVLRVDGDGSLVPDPIDRQIFPTYHIYRNGERIDVYPQPFDSEVFTALDATSQRTADEVP